ncbi:glutathione S-transferase family protein [Aquibacillus salsiterrae]|uniref:Glutathione S-transferase C-terminal domain-containing protein n=1 Tax=Aquibacillus salsiterrae TaxID=2950439 RepID=A0A9X4AF05_9BACI|nr:glutathione S-transferase C-terminal domain-containing protein [Aquibacillus salsiterrae]MDC3417371.1 glutathione S-transferase C-terminal domain-containing protein [Aquibacillus salsiterrae]
MSLKNQATNEHTANNKKPSEISKDGSFARQINQFTIPFGTDSSELPVEADRYRLIWCQACPWAHRAVIVRSILGLDKVISLGTVSPLRPRIGRVDWEFSLDENGKDPVLDVQYLSEIYLKTDSSYAGRPTVPVMVDIKKMEVVNNDYFRLTNYFETEWALFHKENAPDLYPESIREDIDALSDVIFHDINNGVYKCGFAHSQEAYEEAYESLFSRLDELENRLATNRFLFGDFITDADVRLYTTLVRFDAAYFTAFNTNRNLIREFPNLWGYARDLYETPGFGDTTDFDAIKRHYHLSITINPDKKEVAIMPKGPEETIWNTPHDRERISGKKEKFIIRS